MRGGQDGKRLGLYLHIPFCRSKCLYCDFCSFPHPDPKDTVRYAERLCEDLSARAASCKEHVVDTVYFGGGTPTLLPTELLCMLLEELFRSYRVAKDAEISIECNPVTAEQLDFASLRRAGFNRLSVGLQSAHDTELKSLGRRHRFDGFCKTISDARAAGFDNVSADVMFGIPGQSEQSFLQTLELVCAQNPQHLSAYGLTVEEGTPFDTLQKKGRLTLPDEEEVRRMYFGAIDFLASKGYEQYEISNFYR